MKGFFLALVLVTTLAGCADYPVYQRPAYVTPMNQAPVAKVCDASGWYCQNVYPAPTYARPPVYYAPYTPYGRTWSFYWRR